MHALKPVLAASAIALTLITPATVSAHSGATGIVKERMEGFKAAKRAMKNLKGAVRASDFNAIETEATSLNAWFSDLERYFPEGSNAKPSEALDIIWQDFDQFSAIAQQSRDASANLVNAAQSSNQPAAIDAFSDLGASCKACHDDYRE